MQNREGITLIELLVSIAIILILIAIIIPVRSNQYNKKMHPRLMCGSYLKGMANAINVYAFDYRDEYPIAGGKGVNSWAVTTDKWDDPDYEWAGDDNVTVSASLFMLVREADVGVKSFVCRASDQQAYVNETDHDIVELWDFGPNPTEHQSYSYQFPYKGLTGHFPADGTSNPGNAVMADRSPWFDEKLTKSSIKNETKKSYLDKVSLIDFLSGDKWKQSIGNSDPHDREGQNVLFNDGHVEFVKRPDVGTRNDNIYTTSVGKEEAQRRIGIAPTSENIGARNSEDSLLVNDRPK